MPKTLAWCTLAAALLPGLAAAAPADQAERSPGGGPALRLVVQGGYDAGFRAAVDEQLLDGRRVKAGANAGYALSAGFALALSEDAAQELQLTFGWKGMVSGPSDAPVEHLAFPVELLVAWNRGAWRFLGGLTVVLNPTYRGSGLLQDVSVDMDNGVGGVVEVDYRLTPARWRLQGLVGLRAGWMAQAPMNGGGTQGAGTAGLRLGVLL